MRRRKPEKIIRWRIIAAIAIPIFEFFGRYRMRGLDNIPKRGAFVFSPNHISNFDPLTVAYLVWRGGRVPRFLGKASLFKIPGFGWLLRFTGQIPVERGGGGSAAIAAATRLISDELAVIAARLGRPARPVLPAPTEQMADVVPLPRRDAESAPGLAPAAEA